jgi:hypothetical protein
VWLTNRRILCRLGTTLCGRAICPCQPVLGFPDRAASFCLPGRVNYLEAGAAWVGHDWAELRGIVAGRDAAAAESATVWS